MATVKMSHVDNNPRPLWAMGEAADVVEPCSTGQKLDPRSFTPDFLDGVQPAACRPTDPRREPDEGSP
jgi:hypothetical protein